MTYFFTAIVAAVGSFIQRVTGFGFGIFAMIFLPYFFESYGEATALSGMISMVSSILVSIIYIKQVSWKNLIFPIAGCLVTSYLSVQFMSTQNDTTLRLMLGCVLILLSVYFMIFSDKIKIKPTWYGGLIAGLLSGIMGGLFAMGGPPVVVYFMQSEKDVKHYLATIQAYFALTNIYIAAVKAFAGYVTVQVMIFWCIGVLGMLVGLYIGKRVFYKLNSGSIKKLVYGMMAISGAINIITSII